MVNIYMGPNAVGLCIKKKNVHFNRYENRKENENV